MINTVREEPKQVQDAIKFLSLHLRSIIFGKTKHEKCTKGDKGVPPMKSVLIKYRRAEYFSRWQQVNYPLDFLETEDE